MAGGITIIRAYNQYARIVDARLRGQIFLRPAMVLGAPERISPGEPIAPGEVMAWLRRAGYSQFRPSPVGTFSLNGNALEIRPGPESVYAPTPVDVWFNGNQIEAITNRLTGRQLALYRLEPRLLTTLGDRHSEKRRLLRYSDIPPLLVKAVVAIEDRNFFHEGAVYYWRIPAAAWRDLRAGYKEQGFSTITMQVARNFFLSPVKTYRRKLTEILIAEELEERLSKQQIFELYANQAYMGQQGRYLIRGFGQAARVYFHKDVRQLTLPECAMLAGILHAPGLDDPFFHPARVIRRRNQVLEAMVRSNDITPAQARAAAAAPLDVVPSAVGAGEAPWVVEMIRDRISGHITPRELYAQGDTIQTTVDPDLQEAASRAVRDTVKRLAPLLARRHPRQPRRARGKAGRRPPKGPRVQVVLIALDPHTGAVKALVGGRNYAGDPVNHALLQRPVGSLVAPFVDAAALATAISGGLPVMTETTSISDQPTHVSGDFRSTRFETSANGHVRMRRALAASLPNATASLAAQAGVDRVSALLLQAGFDVPPASVVDPLGKVQASPLDVARAYTAFFNGGAAAQPRVLVNVRRRDGSLAYSEPPSQQALLDPRIAFMVNDLMQAVVSNGSAKNLLGLGFDMPAAGKTANWPDEWFVGATSRLLCLVWVGREDGRPLRLGSRRTVLSAWAQFMDEALTLPDYRDPAAFIPPPGVVAEAIDRRTGQAVTPACPATETEVDFFIAGTQPVPGCPRTKPGTPGH